MKNYEATLNEHIPKNGNFNAIKNKNHLTQQSKAGLTNCDNKRYWLNDTDRVPYGDYSINVCKK